MTIMPTGTLPRLCVTASSVSGVAFEVYSIHSPIRLSGDAPFPKPSRPFIATEIHW